MLYSANDISLKGCVKLVLWLALLWLVARVRVMIIEEGQKVSFKISLQEEIIIMNYYYELNIIYVEVVMLG